MSELKCNVKLAGAQDVSPELKELETQRREINKATDNVEGDCFIALSTLNLTTAPIESAGVDRLIEAMRGWRDLEQLEETTPQGYAVYKKDLEGRYLLFSNQAAWRIRDYFQTHPEELAQRKDKEAIEEDLQILEPPQSSPRQKVNAPITPAFLKKPEFEKLAGSLPGFETNLVLIDGEHWATVIKGNPAKGARATMRIKVGAGISSETIEKEFGNSIQYQAPVSMVSVGNKGLEMMADQGKIVNWVFDPRRLDGYLIVYPDGTLHIADKRHLSLKELTRNEKEADTILNLNNPFDFESFLKTVQAEKLTVVGSMYFENREGANYTKAASPADSRRYILEFADGTFGMFDSQIDMTINDSLALIWQLPGVKRVLYCDTGYFEFAKYYFYDGPSEDSKTTRNPVDLGIRDRDTSSNRMVFYWGATFLKGRR